MFNTITLAVSTSNGTSKIEFRFATAAFDYPAPSKSRRSCMIRYRCATAAWLGFMHLEVCTG